MLFVLSLTRYLIFIVKWVSYKPSFTRLNRVGAAKRPIVPEIMARASVEQLLKMTSGKAESLEKKRKRVGTTNIGVEALLEMSKASTETHTEDLKILPAQVAERDNIIVAQQEQIEKDRGLFNAAVPSNTEQTRKLHTLRIKACKDKFVSADVAQNKTQPPPTQCLPYTSCSCEACWQGPEDFLTFCRGFGSW